MDAPREIKVGYPEDRAIVFYNAKGEVIHTIHPRYATPGGRAIFTKPLRVARVVIEEAGP